MVANRVLIQAIWRRQRCGDSTEKVDLEPSIGLPSLKLPHVSTYVVLEETLSFRLYGRGDVVNGSK